MVEQEKVTEGNGEQVITEVSEKKKKKKKKTESAEVGVTSMGGERVMISQSCLAGWYLCGGCVRSAISC